MNKSDDLGLPSAVYSNASLQAPKKNFWHDFKEQLFPTVPKIIIYVVMVFLAPTFLKSCVDNDCHWVLSFFAGYKTLNHTAEGHLTFGMMLLLFFTSYLLSVWIVSAFNALKRARKEIS